MAIAGLLEAFGTILRAPFAQPSLWWFLTPIILLWLVLEIYFGEHKKEKLGWNTSLANGITLLWVCIESMRFLFSNHPQPFVSRFFIILAIMLYGVFIVFISFSHKFSGKITYLLAAPSPIFFLCYVTILWGHGVLTITGMILLALLISYIIVVTFFAILRKILPSASEDIGEETDFDESTDMDTGKDTLGDLKI